MPHIRVDTGTKKELTEIKGELIRRRAKNVSFNDLMKYFIKMYRERRPIWA